MNVVKRYISSFIMFILLISFCAFLPEVSVSTTPVSGSIQERKDGAKKLIEKGEYERAANTYKTILQEKPGDMEATVGLADAYEKNGEYDEATSTLKGAIVNAPEETKLYDELISVYQTSGDSKAALEYIEAMTDTELRRKYLDDAYDRNSENHLVIGNTMGNLSSGGVVAFKDDMIFYCDISNGNKLYRIQNGEETLICDGNISALNVIGDYIYFVDKQRDYLIYKIKTDGTGFEKVGDPQKIMATDLTVIGNKMYFINWMDECKVYSMNIDGSDLKSVTEKSTDKLYAYGSYLFISDRDDVENLYRLSLDGTNEQYIANATVYFVTGYDNNIYFRAETEEGLRIYRMTTDGTVYEQINDSRCGYINADKGYVFYVDFENEGSIVRMNEDGSEQTILCSDGAVNLSVDGDWLYYFSEYNDKKLYRIRKDGTGRECLN